VRAEAEKAQKRKNSAIPRRSGTQKAYLDPETGDFIPPPEHKAADRTELNSSAAHDSSAQEIVEEESPVHGGGVMIDLKGRFRNPNSATVEGAGETGFERRTSDKSE
jgi:hypothetical protein